MEGWRDGGMEGWRDGGMEGWRVGKRERGKESVEKKRNKVDKVVVSAGKEILLIAVIGSVAESRLPRLMTHLQTFPSILSGTGLSGYPRQHVSKLTATLLVCIACTRVAEGQDGTRDDCVVVGRGDWMYIPSGSFGGVCCWK